MNWKKSIVSVLGRFWTYMFKDGDFLLAVENVESLFGHSGQLRNDNWLSGRIQKAAFTAQDRLPVAINLDVASIHRKYADIADITAGTKAFGDYSSASEWTTGRLDGVTPPEWLTDHVFDYKVALLDGIDYSFSDGRIVFYRDPATLGLPTCMHTDASGALHVYYVLFGWVARKDLDNDAVTGFMDSSLSPHAAEAWDIHVNGASRLSAGRLLGAVSGSVVSETAGFVQDVWGEQDRRYVDVGGKIYSAPSSVTYFLPVGSQVSVGDTLFGTLRIYDGESSPAAAAVPGIRVMTDVGELTAANASVSLIGTQFHDNVTGYNYLPLSGDTATVAAYVQRCKEIAADNRALFCSIPDVVNPFLYVKNVLRRRRGCFVSMTADRLQSVDPALDCIRDSVPCSSVVTVFLRAQGEQVTASVKGFTAESGNAAVSEYATIQLVEDSATAATLV